ncbi:MAG: hypothetical protein KJP15_10375 [Gammaproteobacteria bacterium]|nr:hypothetical protein [Gammaproteobacteria bacterium]
MPATGILASNAGKPELARMLHEGGHAMLQVSRYFNQMCFDLLGNVRLQFGLFGFTCKLASHLERSPLIHS